MDNVVCQQGTATGKQSIRCDELRVLSHSTAMPSCCHHDQNMLYFIACCAVGLHCSNRAGLLCAAFISNKGHADWFGLVCLVALVASKCTLAVSG